MGPSRCVRTVEGEILPIHERRSIAQPDIVSLFVHISFSVEFDLWDLRHCQD